MYPNNFISWLDKWLDDNVSQPYKDHPQAQDWARISKIGEEFGEVISAFIGMTGQNPRKGFTNVLNDVEEELADVIITAVLAIQHFTKDVNVTNEIINERWNYRYRMAHVVT